MEEPGTELETVETTLEPTKQGRKRDDMTLLEDRAQVARLLHEGVTSARDIQVRINAGREKEQQVSVVTIRNDIAWLRDNWKTSAAIDYAAYANQVFDELENLKRICFEEFHKSMTPKITTEGTVPQDEISDFLDGKEHNTKITKIKEERREGNVAYIQMIERIIERQCKLRGIDAPSKIALTNSKGEDVGDVKSAILTTLAGMSESAQTSESA
jgi:hypothetical protein